MADKQLNFNRPLLSVRRFSSTVASHKDSRRKNGSSFTSVPPIPSYKSESQSGSLRNPGSVPFVWEHSPGRPKDEARTQKHTKERSFVVPKLPPGRILKQKKQDLHVKPEDSNVTKKERSLDTRDDDDDMYVDALDTPPRSGCGLESDVKQSDTDFLPAAKPMASEVAQHVPWTQVITEKPQEVKKMANREYEKPQLTYGPKFLQFTAHDGEEDSDFDDDEHENMSYKVCGLLPQFCLKGSIGLLNPIPGLSVRTRLPISSATTARDGPSSASSQPARVAIYEHNSLVKHQKKQMVPKTDSTEATNQKNFQKLEGSGLYDRLQGHGISNSLTESSPPPVSGRKEVNLPQGLVSFKELLADEDAKEAETKNLTVEKTLYIDTIHKVKTSKSYSHSSTKRRSNVKGSNVESCHTATESLESDLVADKWKQDKEMGFCKVDQDLIVSQQSGLELPATPPLPKSPSDSWLWRTLPSVSSKTASLRSKPKYPSSNTAARLDKKVPLQGPLLPIPET